LRLKHYSLRTEAAYIGWIRRFILFHQKRHPKEMGKFEVEAFLSHLASARQASASTQNQALAACLFLYREVLAIELPWLNDVTRAKVSQRVPCVLSATEVRDLLAYMDGRAWLMASLLYGTGMRLMECLRLRVKDVDFQRLEITVRQGKGAKDRRTMLPAALLVPLRQQLERMQALHRRDLETPEFAGVVQSQGHAPLSDLPYKPTPQTLAAKPTRTNETAGMILRGNSVKSLHPRARSWISIYCLSRCVRRSWLCGFDEYLEKSFEHRKPWVEQRFLELGQIFACGIYA